MTTRAFLEFWFLVDCSYILMLNPDRLFIFFRYRRALILVKTPFVHRTVRIFSCDPCKDLITLAWIANKLNLYPGDIWDVLYSIIPFIVLIRSLWELDGTRGGNLTLFFCVRILNENTLWLNWCFSYAASHVSFFLSSFILFLILIMQNIQDSSSLNKILHSFQIICKLWEGVELILFCFFCG